MIKPGWLGTFFEFCESSSGACLGVLSGRWDMRKKCILGYCFALWQNSASGWMFGKFSNPKNMKDLVLFGFSNCQVFFFWGGGGSHQRFVFERNNPTWQPKKLQFLRKICSIFWGKQTEITIFRQQLPACCQHKLSKSKFFWCRL